MSNVNAGRPGHGRLSPGDVTARERADAAVAEVGVEAAGGKLAVAALLYTYQCTIACRHCLFGCATGRPRVHMSTPKAVEHLRSLHELGRVIHIAGGECMMYWKDLKEVLERSFAAGVHPHFIETNCSFAVNDGVVAERLAVLKANGVAGILMSADPFHQSFVPPERFLRVRRMARELFGPRNVWCPGAPDDEIRDLPNIAADEARLREYVRGANLAMVGRANRELKPYLDSYPREQLLPVSGWRTPREARDCGPEFDGEGMWEVHIDPYDNIQTNCGVILGNASRISVAEVMRRGPANTSEIAGILARDGGPFDLSEFAAREHGFVPSEEVVSKCDLCYTVRRFLRPSYPAILGPAEVYDE